MGKHWAQFEKALTPQVEERRQWCRYPSSPTKINLTANEQTWTGTITDESIGGLGIQLADASQLQIDQLVDLVYHDVPVQGYIRCIAPSKGGKYRVGIGWPDWRFSQNPGTIRRRKSAQFLAHSGMYLVCHELSPAKDGSASVRLWDGASFQVSQNRLKTQSLEQRKKQLQTLGHFLNVLNSLYGLGQQNDAEALIESILDFEFCESPPVPLEPSTAEPLQN
ncbi:MAG: hypothetical protein GTO53_00330 [Planctomycetales bacterium]|nr:hypothetical protein [Planctomycetales bacterium]NIM07627.1 hypothetical protein [Planctomycetales bacterium]NIN07133.1 hypothetical protein [Planctomycetales bacterium]NIN76227.1 hypothetical protein [Planctomycetales bacterium]NIO33449.1 hypothetical protein [Planctomycetales bacterium]